MNAKMILKLMNLATRKILAGYDCLENRRQKPMEHLLRRTDYYWEAVGIMQALCELSPTLKFDAICKELNEKAIRLVKKHGCKSAYYQYIDTDPMIKCVSYDWLMENGSDDSDQFKKSFNLFGYKITKT